MRNHVLLISVLLAGAAGAEELRLLLPDGAGAAVGVEVKLVIPGGEDRTLVTDSGGKFDFGDLASEVRADEPGQTPIIVADVPGAALGVWRLMVRGDLQLRPEFCIAGEVRTADGRAVEGAEVSVAEYATYIYKLGKMPAEDLLWEPVTTGAAGKFAFRGVILDGWDSPVGGVLRVEKKIGDRDFSGEQQRSFAGDATFFSKRGAREEAVPPIVIHPEGLVAGTVVHRVTGEPIGGAQVRLAGGRSTPSRRVETGDDGGFRFEAAQGFAARRIYVSRPGFAKAELVQIASGAPENPDVVGLTIPLAPVIPVSGKVVDPHSEAQPLTRIGIEYQRKFQLSEDWELSMDGDEGMVGEGGRFEIKLPAGAVNLTLESWGAFYRYPALPYSRTWELEVTGDMAPLDLELPRNPGLLFETKLMPGDPDWDDPAFGQLVYTLSVVGSDSAPHARGKHFFVPSDAWGDRIRVRVDRWIDGERKNIFPQAEFEAKPGSWPVVLEHSKSRSHKE